jgi:tetratricopeptide (TPR) repeat protein
VTADPTLQPPRSHRRRWLIPLAAVLLAGAAGFGVYRYYWHARHTPPVPPDPNPETLERAVAEAVRVAREKVLKEPTSAKVWGNLGEVFLANELEDEAGVCFAEAERLDPANPRWPYLRAGAVMNRDREAALPHLERAVELFGDGNPAPRLLLAESLMFLGREKEAEPHIRRAVERNPGDPRARFDAGLLAIALQDWEAAREHLLRCLDSPFARQKARVQLATVYRRLGDAAKADQFRAEADRVPADWKWADPVVDSYKLLGAKKRNVYRVAEELAEQGHYAEAVHRVMAVVDEYPDDDVAHWTLGKLRAQMGNFPAAAQSLRRARDLAPHKVQPHYYLGLALFEDGEAQGRKGDKKRADELYREAAISLRKALAIKGDDGFAHMVVGRVLKQLGERDEAVSEFRKAVQCNPEYGEMHFRLAEALDDAGHADEARDRYAEALRLVAPNETWKTENWKAAAEARLAELKKAPKKPGG